MNDDTRYTIADRLKAAWHVLTGPRPLTIGELEAWVEKATTDVRGKLESAVDDLVAAKLKAEQQAARRDSAAEHLQILVNAGIVKIKARVALHESRN